MIKLFELRTERELSQRQMSKILNVSQGTYNNWENSKTQPSIEQLIALAKFFNVSVDELIGYVDNGQTEQVQPAYEQKEKELLETFQACTPDTQNLIIKLIRKLQD